MTCQIVLWCIDISTCQPIEIRGLEQRRALEQILVIGSENWTAKNVIGSEAKRSDRFYWTSSFFPSRSFSSAPSPGSHMCFFTQITFPSYAVSFEVTFIICVLNFNKDLMYVQFELENDEDIFNILYSHLKFSNLISWYFCFQQQNIFMILVYSGISCD